MKPTEYQMIKLPGGTGIDDDVLVTDLAAWLGSQSMRDLAAASGWDWPDTNSLSELSARLAELSDDWDFRGRHAKQSGKGFVTRSEAFNAASGDEVIVGDRGIDPDLVDAAVTVLGLVHSPRDARYAPTHIVVLSGTARANANRCRFTAELLHNDGYRPNSIVALGAHRLLKQAERDSCAAAGLPDADTEWATLRDAMSAAFDLGPPELVFESAADEGDEGTRLGRAAEYRWTTGTPAPTSLFVVPSPAAHDPDPRPANTQAQIQWWSRRSESMLDDARILFVTTQIYVPYQQFVAIQVLRQTAPGCHVRTVGVTNPSRRFTERECLQEVRSALLAARLLTRDLSARQD